jgi:phytoene synthase
LRAKGAAAPAAPRGHLLRPLVASAAANAFGYPQDKAFWNAAAAIQLAHEASLVHDDVVDNAPVRRSNPTIAASRGIPAALLEGDHLLTSAYLLAARTRSAHFPYAFARAVERTVAGEKMQGAATGTVRDRASYIRSISCKSGEMFGCAMAIAPLLAGSQAAPRWYVVGRRVGILYQMLDDLLDYCPVADTGKPPFADARQRRFTLPLFELSDFSWNMDVDEIRERLSKPDADGETPMLNSLRSFEKSANEIRSLLAATMPGDETVMNLVGSWVEHARNAVLATNHSSGHGRPAAKQDSPSGRLSLSDRESVLFDDLLRRVPAPSQLTSYFARNSLSFSFAARLIPGAFKNSVTSVYAFCRVTDELADGDESTTTAHRLERLDLWEKLALRAMDGIPSGIPLLDMTMAEASAAGVPISCVAGLIEGMRMDLRGDKYSSLADLRLYSERVAGVVGRWLTHLAGVHEPSILDRAAMLGHALQLTNILRDVGEDLGRGRVYLPTDVLRAFDLTEQDLHDMAAGSPIRPEYRRMLEYLMQCAEADYTSSLGSVRHLPPYFRRSVVVAAHVYRGIHDEIRLCGYDNFRNRARTDRWRKLRLALGALSRTHGETVTAPSTAAAVAPHRNPLPN